MESTKLNDSYNFEDITELWKVTGTVYKESSGVFRISIFIRTLDTNDYLGNFNYIINSNNIISINCESNEIFNKSFFMYGIDLVELLLKELNIIKL